MSDQAQVAAVCVVAIVALLAGLAAVWAGEVAWRLGEWRRRVRAARRGGMLDG